MSRSRETVTVNAAGLVQGIALVTFPAASTVFTSRAHYDLSSSQYGAMFLPQVVTAITAALAGGALTSRFSIKTVYLGGLVADLTSMLLLLTSQFFTGNHSVAYALLLCATAFLGLGFGLTVPALNSLTAAFHPDGVDQSVLVLNALLGAGTVLAPVFVAVFVGLGFWWGLPVVTSVLLAGLVALSFPLPFRTAAPEAGGHARAARTRLPVRFWVFAGFAVLYGICETMNGNWSQTLMTSHVGSSTSVAALALTAFWLLVTLGRVLFAAIQRWIPTRRTFHVLPFVLVVTFVLTALIPKGDQGLGVLVFAAAGFGCSALLPLTLSFAQEQLVEIGSFVTGGVIAFYQLGYGIAAFGAGPLQSAGVGLPTIFGFTAAVALLMGALSFVLAQRHHVTSHLHPTPAGTRGDVASSVHRSAPARPDLGVHHRPRPRAGYTQASGGSTVGACGAG